MAKRNRTFVGAAVLLGIALGPARALAQAAAPQTPVTAKTEPAWERTPYERRGGFAAGVAFGPMLASAAGFPNDPRKIGRERYYTETGVAFGGGGSFWVGAALADWFSLGLGANFGAFSAGGVDVSGGAFILHVEGFPLWPLGGRWRELGALFEGGAGAATASASDGGNKLIDSGGASYVAAGAFYEGFRIWRISTGPFAMFDYMWSDSMRRPAALIGWRTAVYSAP